MLCNFTGSPADDYCYIFYPASSKHSLSYKYTIMEHTHTHTRLTAMALAEAAASNDTVAADDNISSSSVTGIDNVLTT